jgi:glycogen debranching enzyme
MRRFDFPDSLIQIDGSPMQPTQPNSVCLVEHLGRAVKNTILCILVAGFLATGEPAEAQSKLEIARPARTWEAVDAVGQKAAWLGNEAGDFEAWVYPLKILRNFHLVFHAENHVLAAKPLARTVIVQPESTTIIYASDTFSVRETLLVPFDKPGALILLDVHTAAPMEVEARFERDFQMEWPAVLANPAIDWLPSLKAFTFGCEKPEFIALVGSPNAELVDSEYATNYSSSQESSFRLGVAGPGEFHRTIVLAASVHGAKETEATYNELLINANSYAAQAAAHYGEYLNRTVSLELPDAQMQQAYDWARISLVQSMVTNPLLPEGVVAGYRYAADDRRPGYDWFFGRDALWTAFAWDASGDFRSSKTALDFLGHFQRADGKIPHEVPQSTTQMKPLTETEFAYASADATPLYLIAMDDYLTHSGDLEFIRQKRVEIEKALTYLHSISDENHLAKNQGAGTGWIEGGPLFPVRMEIYQASLGVEALKATSRLELTLGDKTKSAQLQQEANAAEQQLDRVFWVEQTHRYAFGINLQGKQIDIPSVLAMVPLWFGQLPEKRIANLLDTLAQSDHQADWGMRVMSAKDEHYNPGGYHFGSIWPLFTGWASVAEYRNHRDFAAYENLRANVLLTYAGTPGRVTEVLSGDTLQELATTTPHQTWSSAMVIEPLLLGMLDLRVEASSRTIALTPHLPADWPSVAVRNIRVGDAAVSLRLEQSDGALRAEIEPSEARDATLELNPAYSLHARIVSVTADGRKLAYTVTRNADDQHVHLHIVLNGERQRIEVRTEGDVRLAYNAELPQLGEASRGLRLVNELWASDGAKGTLQFEGAPGASYEVYVVGARDVAHVEGGELRMEANGGGSLRITIPEGTAPRAAVVLELKRRK